MKTKVKAIKKDAAKVKKTDKVTKAKVIREVIVRKELKYLYPDEIKEPLERKAFRKKVRDELRKLEAEINQAKGQAKEPLQKKLNRLRKRYLADVTAHI